MAPQWTRAEVAAHTARNDAVIIIDNIVYNVTHFLEQHPGGPEILLGLAGLDASRCFHDVGHSEDARHWRETFAVGEVVPHERWELVRRGSSKPRDDSARVTLAGLWQAVGAPLLLAALALLLYLYVLA